jgi:hypothetical protein
MAKEEFVADWSKENAEATFNKLYGCVLQRPNGQVRYTLLGVEEIYCGWGIRVRTWPRGDTYILAHNAILREMVVVKTRPEI